MSIFESAFDYARLIASSPGYRKKGVTVPAGYNPTWSGNKRSDTEFGWELLTDRGERPLLYFVWPGTESLIDVLFDAMAWKMRLAVPYNTKGKIQVYAGHYIAYRTVRESVLSIARAFKPGSVDIDIAGHSYGCGLSVQAAVDIQYNLGIAPTVYLSGSTRHGNQAFVDSYNKRVPKTYRFETANDWATGIPPWMKSAGMRIRVSGKGHDIMKYIGSYKKLIGRMHV